MAFRKKFHLLEEFGGDIWVISECEHPSKFKTAIPTVSDFLWIGESEHKGLGILSFGNKSIKIHPNFNEAFRYVVPIIVDDNPDFILFAIWAMPEKKAKLGYVGQVWRALNFYDDIISDRTILTGDLNSNAIWDKSRANGNHSDVVAKLKAKTIESVYHLNQKEDHGQESTPTIYLLKQLAKPYHLDYFFASQRLIGNHTTLKIGEPESWLTWSDHMPLFVSDLEG